MFLFHLNAVVGSFLKISLRLSITCKIFKFFLMVLVVFVRNQLYVITRGILSDFFCLILISIYILGEWREWPIQPLHAGQLWTENFQVAVFMEPYISLQSCKYQIFKKCRKKLNLLTEFMSKLQLFSRISQNFGDQVTCKCSALNFDVKLWNYA